MSHYLKDQLLDLMKCPVSLKPSRSVRLRSYCLLYCVMVKKNTKEEMPVQTWFLTEQCKTEYNIRTHNIKGSANV